MKYQRELAVSTHKATITPISLTCDYQWRNDAWPENANYAPYGPEMSNIQAFLGPFPGLPPGASR
jgi:hypothetical protein